jgi:hypothetical protein
MEKRESKASELHRERETSSDRKEGSTCVQNRKCRKYQLRHCPLGTCCIVPLTHPILSLWRTTCFPFLHLKEWLQSRPSPCQSDGVIFRPGHVVFCFSVMMRSFKETAVVMSTPPGVLPKGAWFLRQLVGWAAMTKGARTALDSSHTPAWRYLKPFVLDYTYLWKWLLSKWFLHVPGLGMLSVFHYAQNLTLVVSRWFFF